jgi:hypothetical protein
MSPGAFRKLALSLPEAHEEPHFERTSFRVEKKIFATMTLDGKEAMVRVAPPELVRSLLETHGDIFFSYGGWTIRNGSMGVRLAKAKGDMLEALLIESWKHAASKRTVAAFEGQSPAKKRR